MDDDVGTQSTEDLDEVIGVRDIGLDVLDAVAVRPPVPRAPQVDDGDSGAVPVAQ